MAQAQTQSLSQGKFLTLSLNLLHKTFIEASRTKAKTVYRELAAGEAVHLATVEMEDQSRATFSLALEYSEFRGKLNYGGFRASLEMLVGNIAQALRDKKELRVFSGQQGTDAMIFGITAVTVEGETANVMVLAAEPGQADQVTKLQLMYLDPTQFARQTGSVVKSEPAA